MATIWFSLLAIGFEASAIAALFVDITTAFQLPSYLLGHSIACLLFSRLLCQKMPARYQQQFTRSVFFLFIIQFFIPLIGSIGLGTGLLLALHLPRQRSHLLWNETANPGLPYKPMEISSQPLYSQGGLSQVLREASSTQKRIQAVMASKQMNNRDAIVVLQQALKDNSDDVRLLAYAMLDEKEKIVGEQIQQAQQRLVSTKVGNTQADIISQHKLLAGHYWEMAYLGLAQGGVKSHFLDMAKKSCQQVLKQTRDAASLRLLGRIYIETKQPERAEDALLEAIEQGLPRHQLAPYLAEAAWLQRNFSTVHQLLDELSNSSQAIHPSFQGVMHYWLPR